MAMRLLARERRLVCVARSANDEIAEAARERGAALDWYLQDLADIDATDRLATSIAASMPRDAVRYVLINNAALMGPLGAVANIDAASVVATMNVNVSAAIVFTARLLAATDDLEVDRRILNISSGSGRRPMDGNGVYSATKAALDMFSRCLKAEQDLRPPGKRARVVSLAPGVIDTDMQVYARSRDPVRFPQTAYFAKMKNDGALASPEDAARKILDYLDRDTFGATEIDDIRSA
jgi:NAD(P)-dependent dehydrogenase (short-subunit alcohol dehydrogenase family)